jgi:PHD/YefM family antitoxin component YafN of YafNO toxin-antitoxin module
VVLPAVEAVLYSAEHWEQEREARLPLQAAGNSYRFRVNR